MLTTNEKINNKKNQKQVLMTTFNRLIISITAMSAFCTAYGQDQKVLQLADCYTLARQNYPLIKQRELIEKSGAYSLENIAKGNLPQINISGQVTYQSDVTKIPIQIPGVDIPPLPQDQYKLYGEVSQPLTDLITVKKQKAVQQSATGIKLQNLETELYKIRDRINQLFFGTLLTDEQLVQNALTEKDIQTGIDRVTASIKNGTDFRSSLDKLKAEMLKARQKDTELQSARKAYLDMLGMFINRQLDSSTVLERPSETAQQENIRRPELRTYDLQKKNYDLQNDLINTKALPKFSLFFQGGLGQPSPVNMLSKDLSGYYIAGLRLNWSLSAFYTLKKEKKINMLEEDQLNVQKETFLFNTRQSLQQQNEDILKFRKLIGTDQEIVDLRTSVKKAANAQLANGVITVNDYLKEINAEDQARQTASFHRIQLLMAEYNYNTTGGTEN